MSGNLLVSQEEDRYLEEIASLGLGVAREVPLHDLEAERGRYRIHHPSHLAAETAVRLSEKCEDRRQRLLGRASAA